MDHDIFISYAHDGDNSSREEIFSLVARLHKEMEADFKHRFGRDLNIFLDKEDIQDFHHWQVRCHRALRGARFFIAFLSRSYLRSDACRWEWEEWCRHEQENGFVGQGVASLWFVQLEDLASEDAALLHRWRGELLQRFHIQCHQWQPDNSGEFLNATARSELSRLTEHVAQRLRLLALDRARAGNLPWPNINFVGRAPELAMLRTAIVENPGLPVGLHGVGGMGKTALAIAFAYHESESFPGGCWLLRCENRDRLLTILRPLVTDLDIKLTEEEQHDELLAVQRLFNLLRSRGPALFLLDNIDHPDLLAPNQTTLFADHPWTRIIYTTRLAPEDFTQVGALTQPIDLDRLPEDQAVDLIRHYQPEKKFTTPEHEGAAHYIVRELNGLTLAVETAAVFLGQSDPRSAEQRYAVDIRNYLHTLRSDLEHGGIEGVVSQLREVAATLRPTLARLDEPTRTVLQIASLLASDGVALPWLREIAGQKHSELATDAAIGLLDPWTKLIRGLIGLRLFLPTPEAKVVAIHSILQHVLKSELAESLDAQTERVEEHIRLRGNALEQTTKWEEARWELAPFGALAEKWANEDQPGGWWLLHQAGSRWYDVAAWSQSELLHRKALAIAEKKYGPNHLNTGACINCLAFLLQATGQWTEAEQLHRRALKIAQLNFEPDHPNIATALNGLAKILEAKNNFEEAEQLYRKALAIDVAKFGKNNPMVAITMGNLAHTLISTNQFEESESLLRDALNIDESYFKKEDRLNVATSLNGLAILLHSTNRLTDAELVYTRALAIEEACLGEEHPRIATTLNGLAQLLRDTNRMPDAESHLWRALKIDEACYSPDHPHIARDLNRLAGLMRATNRVHEAEKFYKRALNIYNIHPTTNQNDFAGCLSNYAQLMHDISKLNEAEDLYRHALKINKSIYGEKHLEYARNCNNLATLLRDKRQLAEAESLHRRALEISEKILGPNNPEVATSLGNLAGVLQDSNRLAEAEPLYRRALNIDEASFGDSNPRVAVGLNNLAGLLQATSRLEEAELMYRRALKIAETSFGSEHPEVARGLNNLASLLQIANRYAEAEPFCKRALAIAMANLRLNHPLTSVYLKNFAHLLSKTNRIEEAKSVFFHAKAIDESAFREDDQLPADIRKILTGFQNSNSSKLKINLLIPRIINKIFSKFWQH